MDNCNNWEHIPPNYSYSDLKDVFKHYWKTNWVDKGQELRKFNEETGLPERWVAQKDVLCMKE